MSTLRARHLPQQIPEASPQPKSPEPQDEPDRQQERIASDNIQSQPQDPMSSMLPQLLQAMPNGEAMSKTLQQVSQMQSLISQMQTGNGGGMAGLLSMLMSQAGSAMGEGGPQMMQMLPLMMQLMQQRPTGSAEETETSPPSSLNQLTSLFSLLQAK